MRKWILAATLLAVLLVGVWWGRPAYQRWSQERALTQAREFLAKADYRNAVLCARKVLAINSANLEATRVLAHLAELARSPEAVKWRQRIVELEPQVLKNRLDVVRVALVQNNLLLARQALDSVDAAGKRTSEFHQVAAMVAAAGRQMELAERHFAEAAKLEPDNRLLQLDLAMLRLQSRDTNVAQTAERQLEQLTRDPSLRKEALRQLAGNALRKDDLSKAHSYSTQLQAEPDLQFADRLLHLSILTKMKAPAAPGYLVERQREAEQKPEDVLVLSTWMLGNGQTNDALKWLTNLAPALRHQPPVAMALADAYAAKQDWAGLQTLLVGQQWAGLEFLRLALLAQADAQQGQSLPARTRWRAAVREAQHNLKALTTLLQMASAWGWNKEKEDLLWEVAQRFPGERWALEELEQTYLARGDTRSLHKVYAALVGYDANDVAAKNNLATVCLLLGTDLDQAHEWAKAVHDAKPEHPLFTATYAYSLHVQGKTAEGLRSLEKLKPEILQAPAVAAYYGVLLSAAGETNKARAFLESAQRARLLPEEKALVTQTLKKQ